MRRSRFIRWLGVAVAAVVLPATVPASAASASEVWGDIIDSDTAFLNRTLALLTPTQSSPLGAIITGCGRYLYSGGRRVSSL